MFPLVLYPSHLRQCIALFAVVEGWLLLDIGLFVLFFTYTRGIQYFLSLVFFFFCGLMYH